MHARSDSYLSAEGVDRGAATVHDGNDQRVSARRLLACDAETCISFAVIEEDFARPE